MRHWTPRDDQQHNAAGAVTGIPLYPLDWRTWPPIIAAIVMLPTVSIFLGLRMWLSYKRQRFFSLENLILYFTASMYYVFVGIYVTLIAIGWATYEDLTKEAFELGYKVRYLYFVRKQ